MSRILLHICCGPCSIYPVSALRGENFTVHGFFYNPHIQPYQEFEKRLKTLQAFAESEDLPLILRTDYDPETFFRQVAFRETNRCLYCYSLRLDAAAALAKKSRFDAFTTTLLYSKRQKHQLVVSIAEEISRRRGIAFLYRDFRSGWREGQQRAKALAMYRQQYCGCIYSEMERFYKDSEGRRVRIEGQKVKGEVKENSIAELEPCGIHVDENGDWFHKGNRIFRPEILEALYAKLDQSPAGQFILSDFKGRCLLDVADTPFVVSRVDLERDISGSERIIIRVKNISRSAVLDAETLEIGRDNVLYCRVLEGRFPARFSRPAYYQLAEFVREDDAGQSFYIELNGKRFPIAVKSDG